MTVYFIRRKNDASGLIKIGVTSDLSSRLSTIATMVPEGCDVLCSIPGGRDLEGYFHSAFEDDRVSGEWFRPSDSLVQLIATLDKFGLRALPAGAIGVERESIEDDASRAADLELASRLLKKIALPSFQGDSVKLQIGRAARRSGFSPSRTKDLWYREPRASVAAWEMRKLFSLADMAFASTKEQQQIMDLQNDVAEIKATIAALLPELN